MSSCTRCRCRGAASGTHGRRQQVAAASGRMMTGHVKPWPPPVLPAPCRCPPPSTAGCSQRTCCCSTGALYSSSWSRRMLPWGWRRRRAELSCFQRWAGGQAGAGVHGVNGRGPPSCPCCKVLRLSPQAAFLPPSPTRGLRMPVPPVPAVLLLLPEQRGAAAAVPAARQPQGSVPGALPRGRGPAAVGEVCRPGGGGRGAARAAARCAAQHGDGRGEPGTFFAGGRAKRQFAAARPLLLSCRACCGGQASAGQLIAESRALPWLAFLLHWRPELKLKCLLGRVFSLPTRLPMPAVPALCLPPPLQSKVLVLKPSATILWPACTEPNQQVGWGASGRTAARSLHACQHLLPGPCTPPLRCMLNRPCTAWRAGAWHHARLCHNPPPHPPVPLPVAVHV